MIPAIYDQIYVSGSLTKNHFFNRFLIVVYAPHIPWRRLKCENINDYGYMYLYNGEKLMTMGTCIYTMEERQTDGK